MPPPPHIGTTRRPALNPCEPGAASLSPSPPSPRSARPPAHASSIPIPASPAGCSPAPAAAPPPLSAPALGSRLLRRIPPPPRIGAGRGRDRGRGAAWCRGHERRGAARAEPHAGRCRAGAMGQVLGFAHCKESPSTASTTPDSTDGGTESDFPELQTAREFSEDEDTGSLGWATPRELTFSYIAFTPGHDASPPRDARTRRDSGARRPRGGLGAGPGPSPPRPEPPAPALGDSLENIPSLCQSPEGERGQGLGLDPFLAWDAPLHYTNDPEPLELGNSPPTQPQLVPTTKITVEPGAPQVTEAAAGSETALEVTPGDLQLTPALALHPAEGTPCWAESTLSSSGTLEGPGFQGSWDADDPQEEKALLETEPIPEQCLEELDQSGNRLEAYNMVLELVLWRDMRASGLVLTGLVLALLCLAHFSAVSVCAWAALGTLGVTLSLRLYHMLLGALRPGHRPNPFQPLLDTDVSLSPEQLEHMAERIGQHMAAGTRTLRHLFLVEDLVDSLKFAFLFYILTYVGAVFNGLTLLLMGVISAFTFPVLYRHHQAQIDQYVGLVRNQLSHLRAKIQAKLPSAKAKAE